MAISLTQLTHHEVQWFITTVIVHHFDTEASQYTLLRNTGSPLFNATNTFPTDDFSSTKLTELKMSISTGLDGLEPGAQQSSNMPI